MKFLIGMGRNFSAKDEDFMSCYSTVTPGKDILTGSRNSDVGTRGDLRWGQFFPSMEMFEYPACDVLI